MRISGRLHRGFLVCAGTLLFAWQVVRFMGVGVGVNALVCRSSKQAGMAMKGFGQGRRVVGRHVRRMSVR